MGLDSDFRCLEVGELLELPVFIGSQTDRDFLRKVVSKTPKFDILIDDGGHKADQQRITFEEMFSHVKDDGLYVVEDLETSYNPNYDGGLNVPGTFIEHVKKLADLMHGNQYDSVTEAEWEIGRRIFGIHLHPGVVVIEKCPPRSKSLSIATGDTLLLRDMERWVSMDARILPDGGVNPGVVYDD
mmetsp:Transcript_12489/g.28775  ORF Transcript_12489/g.28775 Transcript_12489/m.28775 type:complete len:185 (-) Transcript_12489:31-585(-)